MVNVLTIFPGGEFTKRLPAPSCSSLFILFCLSKNLYGVLKEVHLLKHFFTSDSLSARLVNLLKSNGLKKNLKTFDWNYSIWFLCWLVWLSTLKYMSLMDEHPSTLTDCTVGTAVSHSDLGMSLMPQAVPFMHCLPGKWEDGSNRNKKGFLTKIPVQFLYLFGHWKIN